MSISFKLFQPVFPRKHIPTTFARNFQSNSMRLNIFSKAFIQTNAPLLGYGLLFVFASSFGQTYLLSLYVPSIEAFLNISNTQFGSLYAVATIGSAITLPWLGSWFDRTSLRSYSLFVAVGLAISLFLLSFSTHFVLVLLAFYGLRLFGQGLSGHTAISAMARYFERNRGKAIGLASLGYPLGEALLPVGIALLIAASGWRTALQFSGGFVVLAIIPLALFLISKSAQRINAYHGQQAAANTVSKNLKIKLLLSQSRFWRIAPVLFLLGFTNTAIFFFQLKLGESRGWSPEWVAGSIAAFALAGAFGMLGSGLLVDRFSGKRLFPYYLVPYIIGLLVIVFFHQPLAYPIALALLGLANGMGSTINNALMAEVYGTAVIGQIRSLFTTVMVASTALGPIAFGVLLDAQVSFSAIYGWAVLATLLVMLFAISGISRQNENQVYK